MGDIISMLLLGGMAKLCFGSNRDNQETDIVDSYEQDSDEDDEREIRRLEKEESILEKKIELEKAKFPNAIENIKERVENDYNSIESICLLFALICASFSFLFIMGGLRYLLIVLVFGIVAVILFKIYLSFKSKKNMYMEYISLIIIHGERDIIKIANEMNTSYEDSLKCVTSIIAKNYIKGFYISKNKKFIEQRDGIGKIVKAQKQNGISDMDLEIDNFHKKCPSCGGSKTTKVDGVTYCCYCGSKF